MLRKICKSLRKRSKTGLKPERVTENPEQKMLRLTAQKELDNFWSYDGTEQQPIDPIALMEMSQ